MAPPFESKLLVFQIFLGVAGSLSWLVSGCGSTPTKTAERPFLPIVVSGAIPATYHLADPECQDATEPVPLNTTTVRLWNHQAVEEKSVTMRGVQTLASLNSPIVQQTNYAELFERTCDLAKGHQHACTDEKGHEKGWTRNEPARKLRICRNDHVYDRQSYEGVALSGLYYTEHAYARYLENFKSPLPKLSLSVLPHFVDLYDNYQTADGSKRLKTYITHNMAYFPAIRTVVIFPERTTPNNQAPGFFWESPFVMAHEFGHHIDFSSDQGVRERLGLRWDPMSHNFVDENPARSSSHSGSNFGAGPTDMAQVHGAISEAFADLTAYYTMRGDTSSLVGIPCFGYNRNISEPSFLNGDEKILTDERLGFLLGRQAEDPRVCGEPRYGDIHIIGAVVAHAIDQFFAQLIAEGSSLTPGSDSDFNTRYVLLSRWMQRVYQDTLALADDATGEQILQPVGSALATVANQFVSNLGLRDDQAQPLRNKLCKLVQERLPTMPSPPFAANGQCD